MKIGIPSETEPGEPRVGASPDTVKKLIALGATVTVASGAGLASGITDEDYVQAGATIAPSNAEALAGAAVVLKVRR
ncbi:NAD(P)(+) transhydrogenase (Re/Si-specific) subunit alpha, partial [Labrys sp. ZIDIC5]|nr:NAD(P)(+) transhydrogenase (Re/Si-specific) subunit alpha [Labrys sp. ZIDIC5]